jgi:hypothetical protein
VHNSFENDLDGSSNKYSRIKLNKSISGTTKMKANASALPGLRLKDSLIQFLTTNKGPQNIM